MKILLISTLMSNKLIGDLFEQNIAKPPQSIQKFLRLLTNGFKNNHAIVDALSVVPLGFDSKKKIVNFNSEVENCIKYKYVPYINIRIINNVSVFVLSFCYTLVWCIVNRKQRCIVCFDALKVSSCIGALLACKILQQRNIALVTDVHGIRADVGLSNIYSRIATKVYKFYINSFDKYILLTEQMNEVVNLKRKPYIVMEGLVDINMQNYCTIKTDKKIVLYAGGLYEKYGLQLLIDAFNKIKGNDVELHLYGHGSMVKKMDAITKKDYRIKYFGVVPNNEVVEAQLKATLLINPRPTNELFVKYSFPSKNMEYMASGTPLLTTKLPGMPHDYYEHVYLIERETSDGIYDKLNELLMKTSTKSLIEKGQSAKEFIINNKNNTAQAKRVLSFLNE
jgi:glycosyltransferase involved in cell wall biosynthesis